MMNASFSSQADLFADIDVVDRDGFVEETVESPLVSSRRGEDVHMTPSHIPRMNVLFSSLDELIEKIDVMGRDAFVAEIANNPEMYGSFPDTSRKTKKDKDKDGVIYLLVCLENNKTYVGQTNNFDARMGGHFSTSGRKTAIKNAVNFYGRGKFVSVILLAGIENQEQLDLTEIALIRHLDCLAPGNRGYNLHPGGRGGPLTDEHRKKIGDGNRGKTVSKETKIRMSAASKGRTHTDEARAKISAAKMGKTPTEETRAAMSASHLERYKRDPAKKGLCDKMRAVFLAANQRAVVVTLETGEEVGFESCRAAAKEMCTDRGHISSLARKKIKKSKCKGGRHKNMYFTARFRDTSIPRSSWSRKPKSKETLKAIRKAVVITFIETDAEFPFPSVTAAAKAMGKSTTTISNLVTKKTKTSKCNSGEYAKQFFSARFGD